MQKVRPGRYLIFCFICLGIFYCYNAYRKRGLDKKTHYTYGLFSRIARVGNGSVHHYTYTVSGKLYEGHFSDFAAGFKKEDMLLIKFQEDKPDIHEALYEYRFIPSFTVKDMPVNGWDTFPQSLIFKYR